MIVLYFRVLLNAKLILNFTQTPKKTFYSNVFSIKGNMHNKSYPFLICHFFCYKQLYNVEHRKHILGELFKNHF